MNVVVDGEMCGGLRHFLNDKAEVQSSSLFIFLFQQTEILMLIVHIIKALLI